MYRSYVITLLFFWVSTSYAQEHLGVRLDAYSGMQTAFLNPSHTANLPLRWNLNLAGAGFFFDNSYAYLENTKLTHLLKNTNNIKLRSEYNGATPPSDVIIADFNTNLKKAFIDMQTTLRGPAFSIKLGQHTAGIFYNANFRMEASNISNGLNYYVLDTLALRQYINIKPLQSRALAWSEIGLNYAFRWEMDNGYAQVGTNVKFLNGYEGFTLSSENTTEVARFPKDSIYFSRPDVAFAFTTGNFANISNGDGYKLQRQGRGMAFDIGASWLVTDDIDEGYKWRFSAAFLDLGKIKFKKTAEQHYIDKIVKRDFIITDNYENFETPTEVVRQVSKDILGDSLASLQGNKFSISTPATICLMADYQFFPKAFANVTFQQRILQNNAPLHRSNILAASVRYEHRWFSATLPVVLYNYQKARLGFAARLAYLTIGTDNLGSWLVKKKFTGTDIYCMLVFNPFNLNIPGLKFGGGRRSRGKNVKCYKF